jgi:hypothetical protein
VTTTTDLRNLPDWMPGAPTTPGWYVVEPATHADPPDFGVAYFDGAHFSAALECGSPRYGATSHGRLYTRHAPLRLLTAEHDAEVARLKAALAEAEGET